VKWRSENEYGSAFVRGDDRYERALRSLREEEAFVLEYFQNRARLTRL
jgi:hypothetical protein